MKAFYPADFTAETTTGSYTEECMHKRGSMILQLKEKRIKGKKHRYVGPHEHEGK